MKEQVDCDNRKLGNITLQLAQSDHKEFLFKIFKESRPDLMSINEILENKKTKIIHHQFLIEQQQLQELYPNAEFNVIMFKGEPIGRFYINCGKTSDHIIEIGILGKYRRMGIGTRIMQSVIENAIKKEKGVNLQVAWFNYSAFSFYKKLGFQLIKENGAFYEMQFNSNQM